MKLKEVRDLYERARSEEVELFAQAIRDYSDAGLCKFTGRTVRVCVDGVPCTCKGTYLTEGDGGPEGRLVVMFDGDPRTECAVNALYAEPGDLLSVAELMDREAALHQEALCL